MYKFDISKLEKSVREVPDFPKPGIKFKDITPILINPKLLSMSIEALASHVDSSSIDKIIGIDARGFIFGSLLANLLGKGFIPVRKEGKLPWQTESQAYDLEYGKSIIEIHKDAIDPGERILIVDDLLATGGTAKAAAELVEKMKGKVTGFAFIIELTELNGIEKIAGYRTVSLVKY